MQSIARLILRRPAVKKVDESARDIYKNGTTDMRWFTAACAGFLMLSISYGAYLGGRLDQVQASVHSGVSAISSLVGLTVKTVTLTGRKRASDNELLDALGIEEGDSMLSFSADEVRERLENIGWVSKASVHRLFPNTVLIDIEERKPFAIWQRHKRLSVIDEKGLPLGELKIEDHGHLPLVVGYGAEKAAFELYARINEYRGLKSRIRAVVRVAERRWNLHLINGITVNLPEQGVPEALSQLVKLDDDHGLLSRDIVLVDFRLADRVTIRLTDEAALRRETSFSKKDKKTKKSGGHKI